MAAKLYDPACLTLAEHFLTSKPEVAHLCDQLAAHIQQEVEEWIEYRAAMLAEVKPGSARQ